MQYSSRVLSSAQREWKDHVYEIHLLYSLSFSNMTDLIILSICLWTFSPMPTRTITLPFSCCSTSAVEPDSVCAGMQHHNFHLDLTWLGFYFGLSHRRLSQDPAAKMCCNISSRSCFAETVQHAALLQIYRMVFGFQQMVLELTCLPLLFYTFCISPFI